MDLEQMKQQWSQLSARVDMIEKNNNDKRFDKMQTAQQRLVSQYRTFVVLACLFTALSPVIIRRITDNPYLTLAIELFFVACAVMDFILQRRVSEIDLSTMPVTDVARRAVSIRRLHHIFQLILIPVAILLLAYLAFVMSDNEYFLYGMCGGAAIGIALGLKSYFRFMDDYKTLTINDL